MYKLMLILISFLITIPIDAQSSVWKISKGDRSIYLGGTVHVLKESDYPLPEEFEMAYKASAKLFFEADIRKLESPSVAQSLMAKAMYTDGRTLKSVLKENTFKKLEKEFAKYGLPLDNMLQLKPSMATMMLVVFKLKEMGISNDGVDKHYLKKAVNDTLEIGFLESLDFQVNMITTMGDGNEDEYVRYTLKDLKDMDELADITQAWRTGNIESSDKKVLEFKEEYPDFYSSFLVDRNNDWMPKIEALFEDDIIEYILVGNLHLHGEDGLLKLLKDKGYTIEQL